MTETEAKRWVGKRVRTLDDSHFVPPGTTGTVLSAIPVGGSTILSGGSSGKYLAPTATARSWMGYVEFDDALKKTSLFEAGDSSLEEIYDRPAERAAC